MKKLKLSELDLGDAEVLTRDQLKKVLGGLGSDYWSCTCQDNSSETCTVNNSGTYFVNCCGYSGEVNDPDSHGYINHCS